MVLPTEPQRWLSSGYERQKVSEIRGPLTAESRATTGATEQQQLFSNYFINLSLFSETLFPK